MGSFIRWGQRSGCNPVNYDSPTGIFYFILKVLMSFSQIVSIENSNPSAERIVRLHCVIQISRKNMHNKYSMVRCFYLTNAHPPLCFSASNWLIDEYVTWSLEPFCWIHYYILASRRVSAEELWPVFRATARCAGIHPCSVMMKSIIYYT